MKAGVYSPYWDTLGGGENYMASLAYVLAGMGYQVDLFWPESKLIDQIKDRYGFKVGPIRVNTRGYEVLKQKKLLKKYQLTKQYDLLIWLSDGSLPFLFAKTNLVHFQVPFKQVHGRSLINQLKLKQIRYLFCNSKFTQQVIDQEFGVKSRLLYPPVRQMRAEKNKEKIILSVGRFDNYEQNKRQDVLIDAFTQAKWPGWKLVLAGGVLHGQQDLKRLKEKVKGEAITFEVNLDHQRLADLYAKAGIYWHGAGFGQDLSINPEKAEHFGMSTVEAMSARAVPVVFNGGGLTEILGQASCGFLWNSITELRQRTELLIKDEKLRAVMGQKASERSKLFSEEVFEHEFKKIIS